MVIALDGPAGVGKSTIARLVAQRLGFFAANSGALYRAATYLAQGEQKDSSQKLSESDLIHVIHLHECVLLEKGVLIDGVLRDEELHTATIDQDVVSYSVYRGVREWVNKQLRSLSQKHDLLVEGRDMTHTVFPDADVRIYLEASVEVRAQRRWLQRQEEASLSDLIKTISQRDEEDRQKPWGALKKSEGVICIDTSCLTIEEVCERILQSLPTSAG